MEKKTYFTAYRTLRTKTYPKIKFGEFDLLPEKNYTKITSIFKKIHKISPLGGILYRWTLKVQGILRFFGFVTDFNLLYLED